MAGISFDIKGNANEYIAATRQAEAATRNMKRNIENEGRSLDGIFKSLAATAGVYFSFQQLDNFRQKLISVRGDFQKLEIAFSTMLQSEEKGLALMDELTATAAKTPFDLKGVANGAKQLLAYGVAAEEVNDTIVRLGNIASGLSIPLNDLVYLYGTTMVQGRLFTQDLRQFQGRGIPLADELAKQMGVAKEKISEMVTEGKIGFPEVQRAIESMTNEGGKFFQLMEKQSSSLAGMKSNLDDAVDMMLNQIGKDMQGVLAGTINLTAKLVENYKAIGQAVFDIVVAYGAYKAALMTMSAIRAASTNLTYALEIEELRKLIPLQEMSAYADVNAAVASGKLTKEKAAQIIALRQEAAAHVANLTAIADEAAANAVAALNAKTRNAEEIKALQLKIIKLRESGKTREADALAMRMQTLQIRQKSLSEAAETAVMDANTARTNANTAATNLNTASETANARATNVLALAKTKLTSIVKNLGAAIKANPLMLYAAAIGAAVTSVYKLATASDAAEVALGAVESRIAAISEEAQGYKETVEGLIRTIQDSTSTDLAKMTAYNQLAAIFPALTQQYTMSELAALDFASAQFQVNQQIDKDKLAKLNSDLEYYLDLTRQADNLGDAWSNVWGQVGDFWDNSSFWDFGKALIKHPMEGGFYAELQEYTSTVINGLQKEIRTIKEAQKQAEFELAPFEIKLKVREGEVGEAKAALEQARQELLVWAKSPSLGFNLELPVGPEFDEKMAGKTEQEIRAEQDRILAEWSAANFGQLPFGLLFKYDESKRQLEQAIKMVDELKESIDSSPGATLDQLMAKLPQLRQQLSQLQKAENPSASAISAKEEEIRAVEQEILVKEKQVSVIKEVKAQIKALQEEQETYAANSKEYIELQKRINALQKKLPKTQDKDEDRKEKVAGAKQRELDLARRSEIEAMREREDLANQAAQASIDAESDASKKRIRQRELDHKIELQNIERQKQDYIEAVVNREREAFEAAEAVKKAQNEKYKVQTFDDTAARKAASDSEGAKMFDQIYKDTQAAHWSERIAAEVDAWNSYLEQYGTYEQRRLAITIKYNKLIEEAETAGDKMSLKQQRDKDLYDLEERYKKTASAIQNLFGDLRKKSAKDLDAIADEGEKALNFLKGGQWSADNAFGISEEAFNQIKNSPSDLEEIAKAILNIRGQADGLQDPITNIGEGFTELFASEEGTEAFTQALSKITSGITAITDAIGYVSDSLRTMGEAFGSEGLQKTADGIDSALSVVGETLSGAQAGAAFGPWGAAAGAALGLVTSLISEISKAKDAGHQAEIDRLAKENENLAKSYEDLEDDISGAYSVSAADLIEQQNDLLEQKKANLELMKAEEEAKKNPDDEQVDAYTEQIEEVEKSIEENAEKAQEAITGITFDSFRDNFLSSLMDMEKGTEEFADNIEEDIRKAMYDALLAEKYQSELDDLYDDLAEAVKSKDASKIAMVQAQINDLYAKVNAEARVIDEQLGYSADSTRSSSSAQGIQASQSSVDEMNGRATAIQSHTFSINQHMASVVAINAQILGRVSSIDGNTAKLKTIEKSISDMKSNMDEIMTRGIVIRKS